MDDAECMPVSPLRQRLIDDELAQPPRGQQPEANNIERLLGSGVTRHAIVVLDQVSLVVQSPENREGEETGGVDQLQLLGEGEASVPRQQTVALEQRVNGLVKRPLDVAEGVDSTALRLLLEITSSELQVLLGGDIDVRQRAAVETNRLHQIHERL